MTVVQSPLRRYRMLIVGAIVLSSGVGLYAVSATILSAMSLCSNGTNTTFVPNTVIQIECAVVQDVGQALTFRAAFYSSGSADPIAIPTHLEIKDPDDKVLFEGEFNEDVIIISLGPDSNSFGTYTATLTSLEDETNRIHTGQTRVLYGFGFLTSYSDVSNPLGNGLLAMVPVAAVTSLVGIGIVIYGGIKIALKKETRKA